MTTSDATAAPQAISERLNRDATLLRSLHRPGDPLVLPNAWDAATARAVVAAGFPVVATTSGGIAASLGYEDHEGAPAGEMIAAAARIVRSVDVPVTVDAEAGYGMEPGELVDAVRGVGAAGVNIEDSDHAAGELRELGEQADFLAAVRRESSERGYELVINARIDVFLGDADRPQRELVDEALRRAHAYAEAGVDCVFPITLWQEDALTRFVAASPRPVNVLVIPPAPSPAELAELGVARLSWGSLLHRASLEGFDEKLRSLAR